MDTDSKRRQVSIEQLSGLLEFLKEHIELAKGLTRGRRGELHTLKLWNLCARKLNSFSDGAVKDGKGWSKYWCDWKYRVRRRALEIKAAKDSSRPPPEGIVALSTMEENILNIIGDSAVDNIVIKCDPLEDEDTFSEQDNESNSEATAFHKNSEPRQTRFRKRSNSSKDTTGFIDVHIEDPGHNSLYEKKPKVNANHRNSVNMHRTKATTTQLTYLSDYMRRHPDFAAGRTNTWRGRAELDRQWMKLVNQLNSLGGPIKNKTKWKQAWRDLKNNVKKKMANNNSDFRCHAPGTTGPSPIQELTPVVDQEFSASGPVPEYEMDDVKPIQINKNPEIIEPVRTTTPIPLECRPRKRRIIGPKLDHFHLRILKVEEEKLKIKRERNDIEKEKVAALNRIADALQHVKDKNYLNNEEAAEFLRLERQKLENSKSISESLNKIASEITRLADVMSGIRDALINKINEI